MGKSDKNFKKPQFNMMDHRPHFPKRAVVTGGMPYGNKELHLGHIGGVFIHADTYARFLRDRIGKDNVIFVSGTDCYGSPIVESYRKAVDSNNFNGTIEDFVAFYNSKQKDVLDDYNISLNLFSASGFTNAKNIHEEYCNEFFFELYEKGFLKKMITSQFYDKEHDTILNGRQVTGKCPIDNCQSEVGYSDECSLGHQYRPIDLINPISSLSGKTPDMVDVGNWYFDLEAFTDDIKEYIDNHKNIRPLVKSTISEFLKKPLIYIKEEEMEKVKEVESKLPPFTISDEKHKSSQALEFKSLDDRDEACKILGSSGIRYRNGKTLVPFRLTGNVEWGVKAPELEGLTDLTYWVWPESLFAPISFTKTYLQNSGKDMDLYKEYWCSDDSEIYQFVGSDNIYFYGIAEVGMWIATGGKMKLPNIVANNHVLFLDKKASSSSEVKPPTAKELLNFYTVDQLKLHFLAFGLASKNVGFKPKPFNPDALEDEHDPVLVEGNLYTNVFNKMLRTFFYSTQKYNDGAFPVGTVSEDIVKEAETAILKYEKHMYKYEFHQVINVLDSYIRKSNKYFVKNMNDADKNDDKALRNQTLVDALHIIKTITILSHPITNNGCDMIIEYLNLEDKKDDFWNWDNIFKDIYTFIEDPTNHKMKFLEPKIDFFSKLDCQF